MRHGRNWLALCLSVAAGWAATYAAQAPKQPPAAEEPAADEPTAEEAKEKAVAERFRRVLETNPRRGTALDRLYGYHVERGTLDELVREYVERTQKDTKDGAASLIVGLLESQRGRDAAAVAMFKQAEAKLPTNAMPAYYLGQSLVLVGQPGAAAEAFERAITRKPNRADLLDIFQALGRVYQRAQKTEQALGVWNRLEKLFPDDARVQEQIATTLVEEGQFAQALPRLEKLAEQTEDKYRQSSLRMDVAELKVKLKKSAEALADFEKLLGELNPESWLYRDVRRRVEDVFLRSDDLAGLTKYFYRWVVNKLKLV
jgi:tetratricopeptide (TPR) repeat protein